MKMESYLEVHMIYHAIKRYHSIFQTTPVVKDGNKEEGNEEAPVTQAQAQCDDIEIYLPEDGKSLKESVTESVSSKYLLQN